jgi:hypothetical protein
VDERAGLDKIAWSDFGRRAASGPHPKRPTAVTLNEGAGMLEISATTARKVGLARNCAGLTL